MATTNQSCWGSLVFTNDVDSRLVTSRLLRERRELEPWNLVGVRRKPLHFGAGELLCHPKAEPRSRWVVHDVDLLGLAQGRRSFALVRRLALLIQQLVDVCVRVAAVVVRPARVVEVVGVPVRVDAPAPTDERHALEDVVGLLLQ